MKLYWIHPERDETLTFDLPDGAVGLGHGHGCPTCPSKPWRGVAAIDYVAKSYACAEYPTGDRVEHVGVWPRVRYRIERHTDGEWVAKVSEGDGPAVVVRPSAVTPGAEGMALAKGTP
jgi:hypothetical protein